MKWLVSLGLAAWCALPLQAQEPKGGMFFCRACAHPLDDVICIDEAVSSRAISHGRSGEDDSAIGGEGH
jgi:hypothetical protein